jgi:hypothetical protein
VPEAVEGINAAAPTSRVKEVGTTRFVCGALPVVRVIEIVSAGGLAAHSVRAAGHDRFPKVGEINRPRLMKIQYSLY